MSASSNRSNYQQRQSSSQDNQKRTSSSNQNNRDQQKVLRNASHNKGMPELEQQNAFNQKKLSEQAVKRAFDQGVAAAGGTKQYASRDKDSRNKKLVSGNSYNQQMGSDTMQGIPNFQVNKTTAGESTGQFEGSRNQMLGQGANSTTNKEQYLQSVKKQNQQLLQQQKMQHDQ